MSCNDNKNFEKVKNIIARDIITLIARETPISPENVSPRSYYKNTYM